jgi:hypothetical protein
VRNQDIQTKPSELQSSDLQRSEATSPLTNYSMSSSLRSEFLVASYVPDSSSSSFADGIKSTAAGAQGALSSFERRSIVINASKLRDQFSRETGNSDGGVNSNPFGRHFGNDGAPWCGYFVDRVMQFSGMTAPRMFDVVGGAQTAQNTGHWKGKGYTPGEGDIVVIDFDKTGTIDGADHVGIVTGLVRNAAGKITHVKTIEGNTSAGNQGSQDNGDGIFYRTRSIDQVVGYVVPTKR